MQLRDYQQDAVDKVHAEFVSGKRRVLLVSPTGSGKTVMFAHIVQRAVSRSKTVFILVHRMELVAQVSEKLTQFGVQHGFIARGRTPDMTLPVQVCMVQTLVRRKSVLNGLRNPDLIICDEAHHAAAGSWKTIIEAYPSARILGVSATPERLDGKGLSDVFESLVRGPEVMSLIERGFLARPRYWAPTAFTDENIRKTAGDYNKQDLEKWAAKSTVTGDAVGHYTKLCPGAPAVAFCVTVEHARKTAEAFNAAGYRFETIDGTLDAETRKNLVKKLGSGEINGLCSCEIISEGFDIPIVTAAILLRPTASCSLFLQQVGRVLRPSPGKEFAVVIDHVGNIHRHGLAESYRDWSLLGAVWRKKRAKKNVITTKQCPKCYCCHVPQKLCPSCGHEYIIEQRKLKTVDGELVEFNGVPRKPLSVEDVKAFIIERTDAELETFLKEYNAKPFPGVLHPHGVWQSIQEPNDDTREILAGQWATQELEMRKSADRRETGRARTYSELLKLGQARGYRCPAGWARHMMTARS
jgi:DNA repair protein RadD